MCCVWKHYNDGGNMATTAAKLLLSVSDEFQREKFPHSTTSTTIESADVIHQHSGYSGKITIGLYAL